jgi:hypothetical protein
MPAPVLSADEVDGWPADGRHHRGSRIVGREQWIARLVATSRPISKGRAYEQDG